MKPGAEDACRYPAWYRYPVALKALMSEGLLDLVTEGVAIYCWP